MTTTTSGNATEADKRPEDPSTESGILAAIDPAAAPVSSETPAEEPEEPQVPLKLKVGALLMLVTGGTLFGLSLGTVPVYLTLDFMNEDCESFTAERGCTAGSHRNCVWVPSTTTTSAANVTTTKPARCAFSDYATVDCSAGSGSADACKAILADDGGAACTYDYQDDVCLRAYGMSAIEIGMYASANVLGGLVGAPVAEAVTFRLGFTGGGVFLGLLAAVTAGLASVARATGTFPLMVVTRVAIGIMGFGACFLAPFYPFHVLPPAVAGRVAPAMQVAINGGIALAAAYGLAVEPRDLSKAAYIEARIHGLHAIFGALGLMWAVIAIVVPESPWYSWRTGLRPIGTPEVQEDEENSEVAMQSHEPVNDSPADSPDALVRPPATIGEPATHAKSADDAAESSETSDEPAPVAVTTKTKIVLYATAFTNACALHATGLGAVISFAPQVTSESGFKPLEGNMLFGGMLMVGAVLGPFFARAMELKKLFTIGTLLTAVGSALIAIAMFPFMAGADKSASLAVAFIGLFMWAIGFGAITGSLFFVWAQKIFPANMVQTGSAVTNTFGGLIQLIVTLTFPIAVVSMSGGVAGDQRVGTGAIFTIYAVLGLIVAALNGAFLKPWEQREQEMREEQEQQQQQQLTAAATA